MDLAFYITTIVIGMIMVLMGLSVWCIGRAVNSKNCEGIGSSICVIGGTIGFVSLTIIAGFIIHKCLENLIYI